MEKHQLLTQQAGQGRREKEVTEDRRERREGTRRGGRSRGEKRRGLRREGRSRRQKREGEEAHREK